MADPWEMAEMAERIWFRMRNQVSWAKLKLGNDDDKIQHHQLELYQDEIRSGVNRLQEHGLSTMPLPGAYGLVVFNGGQRSLPTVLATEDPRYRPTGLKPGETHGYMIDEAQKDGTGGKMRSLWKGALGWVHTVLGKKVHIGDDDTEEVIIKGKTGTVTIQITGQSVTITGTTGDVVVNGISLVHHTHPDPQGGNTGQPQ